MIECLNGGCCEISDGKEFCKCAEEWKGKYCGESKCIKLVSMQNILYLIGVKT